MARITAADTGSAINNINLITSDFNSEPFRNVMGYDVGVLDRSFTPNNLIDDKIANNDFMFRLQAINNNNISIGQGMAVIYGKICKNETPKNFTIPAPSSGTKYAFIYIELDRSDPAQANAKIDIYDNGNNPNLNALKDNLVLTPNGKYQLILYRLSINQNGQITATNNWNYFGINTIKYPLKSVYTDYADSYTNDGNLKTKFDSVENSISNINTRLNDLGFKTGSTNIPGATLTKMGRYAKLFIPKNTHVEIKNYTMSFTSNERLELGISAAILNVSGPIILNKNSNIINIGIDCITEYDISIGFEIIGW